MVFVVVPVVVPVVFVVCLPDALGKIRGVTDRLLRVLRQGLSVPGPELGPGRGGILGRVGPGPLELEDQVVVAESLEILHRLGGVVLVDKGHKGEAARLEGLLVLGQIDAGDAPEGLEEVLQVGLRGVLRDVRNADRVQVVRSALRLDAARHGAAGRGGNVFSARGAAPASTDDVPPAAGGGVVLSSLDAVLALELALLLLRPELVEVRREVLGRVLVLEVVVGVRVLYENVVLGQDRRALGSLGAVLEGVSELFPLAAFLDGLRFADGFGRDLYLGDGLQELGGVGRVLAVRGDDLDALRVDAGLVGGRDHQSAARGAVARLVVLNDVFVVGIIVKDVSPSLRHGC
mmetsp:Transcript_4676/g.9971  ORF Transcript_4676/g.9971 Transcript_4676/m.9971 type:complete len:347 (+) Transcript_4676:1824-2864(+)